MNPAALLLTDPSPILRRLVLRDLLARSDEDAEMLELAELAGQDAQAAGLLARQSANGAWQPAALSDGWGAGPIQATALALMRLGYLGFDHQHSAVSAARNICLPTSAPTAAGRCRPRMKPAARMMRPRPLPPRLTLVKTRLRAMATP